MKTTYFFADLKLLPESEEDARMASLLRLVPTSNPDEKRSKIENESIFSPGSSTSSFGGKLKSMQVIETVSQSLFLCHTLIHTRFKLGVTQVLAEN